MRDLTTLRRNR